MTDLEMTKLCAKVMCWKIEWSSGEEGNIK